MDIYQYFIEYLNTPDLEKQKYLAKLAKQCPTLSSVHRMISWATRCVGQPTF